jgi:hypothetical protein
MLNSWPDAVRKDPVLVREVIPGFVPGVAAKAVPLDVKPKVPLSAITAVSPDTVTLSNGMLVNVMRGTLLIPPLIAGGV